MVLQPQKWLQGKACLQQSPRRKTVTHVCNLKMKGSNRCRMHFGHTPKLKTHGRLTIQAEEERKQQRAFLKEMRAINREIEKAD